VELPIVGEGGVLHRRTKSTSSGRRPDSFRRIKTAKRLGTFSGRAHTAPLLSCMEYSSRISLVYGLKMRVGHRSYRPGPTGTFDLVDVTWMSPFQLLPSIRNVKPHGNSTAGGRDCQLQGVAVSDFACQTAPSVDNSCRSHLSCGGQFGAARDCASEISSLTGKGPGVFKRKRCTNFGKALPQAIRRIQHAIETLEKRILLSTTVYVDSIAPGSTHDGSSWADAYTDLQKALSAAVSGQTIEVAQGTYYPTAGTDQTATFQLIDGVAIQGGFAGYGQSNPDAQNVAAYPTILSGDIGTVGVNSDNSYHVVTGSGTDSSAILDGFAITGGNADGGRVDNYYYNSGGGMLNLTGSPSIRNCTFSGNSAADNGGGMYNASSSSPALTNCTFSGNDNPGGVGGGMCNNDSSPTLTYCTFSDNSDLIGGGIDNNTSSSPTLTNCTFDGNSAGGDGGGIENNSFSSPTLINCTFRGDDAGNRGGGVFNNTSSSPTLTNCEFEGNSADSGGAMDNLDSSPNLTSCILNKNSAAVAGGMYNGGSSPTLTNCSISDNSSNQATNLIGGGGMVNSSSSPILTNCSFSENTAINGGNGIFDFSFSSSMLSNCIFWGDSGSTNGNEIEIYSDSSSKLTITFSDIQGGYSGAGNINADPLFVDAANGNLQLQAGSPCIDAGNNSVLPSGDSTDLAGNPRIVSGTVDMGAYEYQGQTVVAQPVPTSLLFAQQPRSAVTGAAITTAIVVDIEDQNGNVLSGDDADVTISVVSGPSSVLSGTATVAAVNGIAAFSNLALNTGGTYTLMATDSTDNLTASSNPFVVSPQTGGTSFASLSGGLLSVNGTSGNDTISLVSNGAGLTASLNGEASEPFALPQITSVDVSGLAGNDSITIGANIPGVSVSGGQGADTIIGGNDAATLDGGAGGDSIAGGAGADSISGDGGSDTLSGGGGPDTLVGGAGNNVMHGGNGSDSISSGSGSFDTIYGGAGQDTIGALGSDNFPDEDVEVILRATIISGYVSINGQADMLSILRSNLGTIRATKPTWLVIHGWNSSPIAANIQDLSTGIQKAEPTDQVLTLDWSSAADTGILDPRDAENAVPSVGAWAARALQAASFDLAQMNIAGHSYGSYVGEEIAMNTPGGINGIIALDPGQNVSSTPDGFDADSEIKFSQNTQFSWAFYGEDAYGDATTAATADESFLMQLTGQSVITGTVHNDVPDLFANMIISSDPVSQDFSLSDFLNGIAGPWKPDQCSYDLSLDAFDAKIISDSTGVMPAKLKYYPTTGSQITVKVND
jgi:parallel beta-helix repeat protein